jgi:hypothetical protein
MRAIDQRSGCLLGEGGGGLPLVQTWDKVLDDSNKPFYRWFTGGRSTPATMPWIITSTRGAGDQLALIYDSPVTDTIKKYTYSVNCATRWPSLPACSRPRAWKRAIGC